MIESGKIPSSMNSFGLRTDPHPLTADCLLLTAYCLLLTIPKELVDIICRDQVDSSIIPCLNLFLIADRHQNLNRLRSDLGRALSQ